MRAVVITKHGGPEVLEVQERPDPVPGPDEVVVDVKAAGLNFAEVMARTGLYPDAPKPPCVVGYEVAGVVEGTDERVVAPTRFGGHAEKIVARRADLLPLSEDMSFEQGAALPVNYATAWAALVRYGTLQRGERVLIHAAAGGVGIAATQLAKDIGAEIWGTASPGKHAAIRELGVDQALDYTTKGWERGLPSFDLVMDAIGGASFRRSYRLLRAGGRLVCFGASSLVAGNERNVVAAARTAVQMPWFSIIRQMSASKSVLGLNVLTLWDEHGAGRWSGPLTELIEDGTVRPVVAQAFPFERAGEAHTFISERRNLGKVVLIP
ncbi:MAG TPA: zinc-binding dehydrogenase [Solirubrobacteraceae bacterium]